MSVAVCSRSMLHAVRRRVLFRSVQRLLPAENVHAAAMLWGLHRHVIPITIAAVVGVTAVGFGIGAAGATVVLVAVATAAATAGLTRTYRVLALTDDSFVMMRGSSIRLQAREVLARLPHDIELRKAGGSLLTTEWRVDGTTYTVRREWENAMEQMAEQANR